MYIKTGTIHANGSINFSRTAQVSAYFDDAGNQLDEGIFGGGGGSGGGGDASAANQVTTQNYIGPTNTTAPATDTAASSLNGRLQRVAQNLTTLNTTMALTSPISNAAVVTPSDTVNLTSPSRTIYVATAGDVRLTMVGGQTITWPGLTVGWHPIRATRIFATDTTATGIVVGW